MQEEEPLKAVTFFDSLAYLFFDVLLVFWTILHVSLCPIISCSRPHSICYSLAGVKYVSKLSTKYLLLNYSTLHIDDYWSCLKIINPGTRLQVDLPILPAINISKEWAESLIINTILIIERVFSESKVPKTKTYLVAALTNLNGDNFSRHD